MQSKGWIIIGVILLLAIYGRQEEQNSGGATGYEGYGSESSQNYPLTETDITHLDCAQLDFMMKKYTSIGDQAAQLANRGNSPAATASAMTAMQAYNQVTRYGNERARRCF